MQPGNMDHGGEAARTTTTTTVESTDLGMAGAVVHGGEANVSTGTFHGQLGAAAARRAAAYHVLAESARHVRAAAVRGAVPVAVVFRREPVPVVAYASIIGASWQQQTGPRGTVLVGPQLADGVVVRVHDSSLYSVLEPRPGAGRGGAHAAMLPGGVDVVYNRDYALQLRQGAGHAQMHADLLPDGAAGHGEAFVGRLPGGGGGVAAYDGYGYYPWQPCAGAGRGEMFVGVVFDDLGNFAQQTRRGTGRANGIGGMLRDANLGAGDDDPSMVAERLRRLLVIVGIGACSVAVNRLAADPGSPAVAFHLFVLLLGGLFLVILHVLRM